MRLLVVDDDPIVRKLLTRLLKMMGVECIEASSHAEAMEQVGLEEFDAALVDVNLGTEDGIDLAVLLLDMRRSLRIVVMSADSTNEIKVREMGLSPMLIKPFTTDELKERLRI
ncbi:MAG: Sensory transduction protein LytR [Elusimicrobia bacterium]|nr:Sensory transduction protein LytR [Elusimicrobiota bacterium]